LATGDPVEISPFLIPRRHPGAFPRASTGTLLPASGLVAFDTSGALVAGHLARETHRAVDRDGALTRAAVAGVLVATIVAWVSILGALALVAL
jgi:hypothetical protein